ncbi:MAG: transposase [Elusimicrobia bacterium]|nr:transposase [Elusimicrobiota bacterium]
MARPLRIEFPGAWYHVINRGRNHDNVFLEPGDYDNFLSLLSECRALWTIECHAYCLMPNHYHLLVHTPAGNLSRAIRHLNGVYAQRFNKLRSKDGSLFCGRYKAILIDGDSYLLQAVRYIHLNPVQSKLIKFPEDYRWSSYRFYCSCGAAPSYLLKSQILNLYGSDNEKAAEEIRKFTEAGLDEETKLFYTQKKIPPVRASGTFKEWIKNKRLPEQKPIREVPQSKSLLKPPSLETIVSWASQAYEIPVESIKRQKRGSFNEARDCAIYLSRQLGGYSEGEIGRFFGGIGYTAVSNICDKIEKLSKENTAVRQRVSQLDDVIREKNSLKNDKEGQQMTNEDLTPLRIGQY